MKSFVVRLLNTCVLTLSLAVVLACDVYNDRLIDKEIEYSTAQEREIRGGDIENRNILYGADAAIAAYDDIENGSSLYGADAAIAVYDITAIEDVPDDPCTVECPAPEACAYWVLEGTGCQARCVKKVRSCQDGDGCCPSECDHHSDSDCSSNCGDGVVQTEEGELCEPGWTIDGNAPAPELVCPTDCPDDGDPCTEEHLSGDPKNCNAECSQTIITSFVDGDSCCPDGGNADTDSDCEPVCGNGVREAEEACDGTEYCDEQCRSLIPDNQAKCIKDYDIHTGECEQCTCANCAQQALNCFDSEDTNLNALCTEIVACAHQAGCVGAVCYCGSALNPDTDTCIFETPNGPCREVIEKAAGSTRFIEISRQFFDIDTAVGRASAFGRCYEANCLEICR